MTRANFFFKKSDMIFFEISTLSKSFNKIYLWLFTVDFQVLAKVECSQGNDIVMANNEFLISSYLTQVDVTMTCFCCNFLAS